MENGLILDPVADNPYYVSYENGTWAHVEVIFQYDPRNRAQIENMKNMSMLNLIVALEKCSEPMFSYEPPFKKLMSPMCGDFSHWQKMISGQLDPGKSADTGRYLAEEDFDMTDLPEKQATKLKALFEKYKWVDGHPPE